MNATYKLLMATTILGFVGTASIGQTEDRTFEEREGDFIERVDQIDDQFDDLDDDVEDIQEGLAGPDTAFGNAGRKLGFSGSIAASGNATSGNSDSASISVGSRLGFFDGVNGHNVRLTYFYAENDGEEDENRLLAAYDYTRDFSPNFYGYANTAVAYESDDELETDAYASVGVGYRVFNTPDVQWSIQAGPAYRYIETNTGDVAEEAALAIGSNYFNRISENLTISNETDIIASESDTYVLNDAALTSRVSDQMALRTSLLTEYHSDPVGTNDEFDNTFGVSVVYNFN
ncbi:putative salt-induced outer membrane protein [Limimaricola variabilis]|uniref:Salt-induced outer membrane protein n=1 Tax=Limimaricola variabilis TaxID=1492771 RepID=A0ABR6HLY2_9RHOB|nr:DUF481 domain-containing protein [Limimaricola variabilis]MBB3711556.1 putative salt-induced outer membrane protein [Limimaricola variabilis]